MQNALSSAVEETLQNVCVSKAYALDNRQELEADFCQTLLEKLQTGSEGAKDPNLSVKVEIAAADLEKGLLSVRVTETFTYPNGSVGTVTGSSTAILERETDGREVVITYYVKDEIYKQYGVQSRTAFPVPQAPEAENGSFCYWIDEDTGEEAVFPEMVSEDKNFRAVFR